MENRKNPKLDIYQHSGLFFQVGMLVTLLLVISAFEWRSQTGHDQINLSHWQGWQPDPVITVKLPEPRPPKPKTNLKPVPADDPAEIELEDLAWDNLPDVPIPETEPDVPELPVDEEIEVVDIADRMPEPEGGYEAFYEKIMQEMKYPELARKRNVEGKVFISFIVDEHGNMTGVEIAKGIGSGCDEEVLRVLKNSPRWKPGWKDNRLVRVRMILPVVFKLN